MEKKGFLVLGVTVGQEVYFYSDEMPDELKTPGNAIAQLSVVAVRKGEARISLRFPKSFNIVRDNAKPKKAAVTGIEKKDEASA